MSDDNMICGREYTVAKPTVPKWGGKSQGKPRPRYLVKGVTHKNGASIRFKSLANAERHMRTMGMVND